MKKVDSTKFYKIQKYDTFEFLWARLTNDYNDIMLIYYCNGD